MPSFPFKCELQQSSQPSRESGRGVMIYTPKTLSEHWQCDNAVIYRLIAQGRLQAFRLGGKLWRIRGEAVEAYEQCQTTGSAGSRGDLSSFGRRAGVEGAIALAHAT